MKEQRQEEEAEMTIRTHTHTHTRTHIHIHTHTHTQISGDLYPNHRQYHESEHALLLPLFSARRAKPVAVVAGDIHMAVTGALCHTEHTRSSSSSSAEQQQQQQEEEKEKEESTTATTCIPAYATSSITKGSEAIQGTIITLFVSLQLRVQHPSFAVGRHSYSFTIHRASLINNFLRLAFDPLGAAAPVPKFTLREHSPTYMRYHDAMLAYGAAGVLSLAALALAALFFGCARCIKRMAEGTGGAAIRRSSKKTQ